MRKIFYLILLSMTLLFSCDPLLAEPPHPRKAYKFEVLPQSQVVLYFLENGFKSRYVYPLIHEAEPAVGCNHSYGKKSFKLITYDTSHPYFYTVNYKPDMVWDAKQKTYVIINK